MSSDSLPTPSDASSSDSPELKTDNTSPVDSAPATEQVQPQAEASPASSPAEPSEPVASLSGAEHSVDAKQSPLAAKPETETPVADAQPNEATATEVTTTVAVPTETAHTETATSAAAPTSPPPTDAAERERKFKIQVGSRHGKGAGDRPTSSRPATATPQEVPQELIDAVKPAASFSTPVDSAPIPVPSSEPVPVPSVREPISADLQSELDAAMGGAALDDLMAVPEGTGATDEIEADERRNATVIRVEGENVFFDLGGRVEGLVSIRQFKEPPAPGDTMEVVVRSVNRDDGFYELSVPGQSVDVSDWSDVTEGAIVEARITGANTGGLECMVGTIRGFIPASQVAMFRVEEFADYIGQKLPCVCTEVNPKRKNLVVSHRAVLEREREESRKKLLEELKPGDECEGIVRNLRDFGAFVDLGGVDGLIHISQLSWERVKHPSDVLTEGQKVKVKIEKVNLETGKIGLIYRDLSEHPWNDIETKCVVGSSMNGTVTRTAKFGAFVRLIPGVEGLIHISELAHQHVRNVDDVIKEGQEIEVKILSVDRESQRIALSLKATLPEPEPEESEAVAAPEQTSRPKRTKPLKGGVGHDTGGESVGLNW